MVTCEQLPGIVTLRLAADFLVDYLWRRYWGPQAEHLAFVWGAYDQLISRWVGGWVGLFVLSEVVVLLVALACPAKVLSLAAFFVQGERRMFTPSLFLGEGFPKGGISGRIA